MNVQEEIVPYAKVILYSKDYCFYCTRAKNLLVKKGVSFDEIDITHDYEMQDYIVEKSGKTTVPQIFINNIPIGGFTDMRELDKTGELDKLLFPYKND